MLELSGADCKLFRNNVGLFKTKDGRTVKTGLCNGSSDVIGITSVTITPDMVGKKIGVFTAIEVKKPNKKMTKIQQDFVNVIKSLGGFAGMANSVETAKEIISNGEEEV